MTVKELIGQLEKVPNQKAHVYFGLDCERITQALWCESDNCVILSCKSDDADCVTVK